jgi:hypothetical protein
MSTQHHNAHNKMKTFLTIMAAALLIAGCETKPQVYYPPVNPASVTMTTEGYGGKYQVVKDVFISSAAFGARMTNAEITQELRRQAAVAGADMVINLRIEHDDVGWNSGYGVAIKTIK